MTATIDDDEVRRAIRDAMDRLIDGKPLYSGGKLTVKSLAEEARVKRWVLTHRHTDLQDEFRARLASANAEPPILRALRDDKADAQKRVKKLTADVTALQATVHQLERIIAVLALENHELRSDRARSGRVVPLRTTDNS
jgi:phage shock protein A